MKKKDISRIYNYWDRWWERCSLTSRCFLYAKGIDLENLPEADRLRRMIDKEFPGHRTFKRAGFDV